MEKRCSGRGLKYAFEIYGAKRASLGVFEDNLPAYSCYKAVGFQEVVLDTTETYHVLGEEWKCKEMAIENRRLPVRGGVYLLPPGAVTRSG